MQVDARRANRVLATLTVTFLVLMMINTSTMASSVGAEHLTTVPEYIYRCYDGDGFANRPRLSSELETTLEAVKLLFQYDQSEWRSGTWQRLDSIAEDYASMQSGYRGGFVAEGNDAPDFKTTALVLETLKLLDRLDTVDIRMVERYLWSSFRGSLSLKHLLDDGLLEDKYWAIRAANAVDNIEILGLRHVSLDTIISPDANLMEFPEIDGYVKWRSTILSNDSMYGGGFEARSLTEKMQVVEILDIVGY